MVPVTFVNS